MQGPSPMDFCVTRRALRAVRINAHLALQLQQSALQAPKHRSCIGILSARRAVYRPLQRPENLMTATDQAWHPQGRARRNPARSIRWTLAVLASVALHALLLLLPTANQSQGPVNPPEPVLQVQWVALQPKAAARAESPTDPVPDAVPAALPAPAVQASAAPAPEIASTVLPEPSPATEPSEAAPAAASVRPLASRPLPASAYASDKPSSQPLQGRFQQGFPEHMSRSVRLPGSEETNAFDHVWVKPEQVGTEAVVATDGRTHLIHTAADGRQFCGTREAKDLFQPGFTPPTLWAPCGRVAAKVVDAQAEGLGRPWGRTLPTLP